MVTPEEIRQLALLAKLEINEDEIEPLARQMEKIIAFADTINSAETIFYDHDRYLITIIDQVETVP